MYSSSELDHCILKVTRSLTAPNRSFLPTCCFPLANQLQAFFSLRCLYLLTVEPLLTDDSLIRTPLYYGQFAVSQQNSNIFSFIFYFLLLES